MFSSLFVYVFACGGVCSYFFQSVLCGSLTKMLFCVVHVAQRTNLLLKLNSLQIFGMSGLFERASLKTSDTVHVLSMEAVTDDVLLQMRTRSKKYNDACCKETADTVHKRGACSPRGDHPVFLGLLGAGRRERPSVGRRS